MANEAMDEVRRQEMKQEPQALKQALGGNDRKLLKSLTWGMRRNPQGWSAKQTNAMHWLQHSSLKSARAWRLKMALRTVYAKAAEENSDDPFLIALADRAAAVRESFEDRQTTTAGALDDLLRAIEKNLERKRWQAEQGLDDLTSFVFSRLTESGIAHPELVSKNVSRRFADYPHWRQSEFELRELRKKVTFAIFAEEDDMDKVTAVVESLFAVLQRSYRP